MGRQAGTASSAPTGQKSNQDCRLENEFRSAIPNAGCSADDVPACNPSHWAGTKISIAAGCDLAADCQEQAIKVRRKIARTRSFYRGNTSKFRVVICIFLLKNRDCALASACVDSFSVLIVENIVAITYRGKLLDDVSRIGIEDQQPRWHSGHDE
jgi:hypothetical protein